MKEGSPGEKRIFSRSDGRVNLKYKVVKSASGILLKSSPEQFAITKDLSAGGVCFIADQFLPLGTVVEVTVELLDSDRPVNCLAKIMRAIKREDGVYYIGVSFLDILSGDRARLERYTKEQW